jgi:hypothetical protein
MRVGKLVLKNGIAVEEDVIEINQTHLTSDCWLIQFHGLRACTTCECRRGTKNHKECGGGETLKAMEKDPAKYLDGHVI